MNLYTDTEFTGLNKNCDLISIGVVNDDGNFFYAELTDYNINKCDDWVKENVIKNLGLEQRKSFNLKCNIVDDKYDIICKGDKGYVRAFLLEWIIGQGCICQFVGDVSHYDFVLLMDLLFPSTALDIPDLISPACYDINQDLALYENISVKDAFDISRERFIGNKLNINEDKFVLDFIVNSKHNALYDAMVIKECYNKMRKGN